MSEKMSQKRTTFVFVRAHRQQTFIECVSNQYTHIDIPDVPASYGTFLDFIAFFGYFHIE